MASGCCYRPRTGDILGSVSLGCCWLWGSKPLRSVALDQNAILLEGLRPQERPSTVVLENLWGGILPSGGYPVLLGRSSFLVGGILPSWGGILSFQGGLLTFCVGYPAFLGGYPVLFGRSVGGVSCLPGGYPAFCGASCPSEAVFCPCGVVSWQGILSFWGGLLPLFRGILPSWGVSGLLRGVPCGFLGAS